MALADSRKKSQQPRSIPSRMVLRLNKELNIIFFQHGGNYQKVNNQTCPTVPLLQKSVLTCSFKSQKMAVLHPLFSPLNPCNLFALSGVGQAHEQKAPLITKRKPMLKKQAQGFYSSIEAAVNSIAEYYTPSILLFCTSVKSYRALIRSIVFDLLSRVMLVVRVGLCLDSSFVLS
ncbi:hypothetical protein [Treponema primitia]|uniref:hypothetical protein n=1 Tax=Treponema primitia TaxID=88058 RepID=UPI0012FDEDFC|nr:hypothetical protein [Treponema primitia]